MVRRFLSLFVFALVLLPSGAGAQTVAVAQLSGTVLDDSGGALPGVDVTVTQTNTGMTRSVVTGGNGDYVFTNLPVGPYKLSAKLSGFNAFEQTGIVLAVGDTRSVNVAMKIGGMSETVRVQADAALVETRSVNLGTVVARQIVDLPLNGRSVLRSSSSQGPPSRTRLTDNRQSSIPSPSRSPADEEQHDVSRGRRLQQRSAEQHRQPDAVPRCAAGIQDRERRAQRAYGMSTGATVNAVTKSGTTRSTATCSTSSATTASTPIRYFEQKKNGGLGRDDGLRRNQIGGTFRRPDHARQAVLLRRHAIQHAHRAAGGDRDVPTADVAPATSTRIVSAACRGGTARTLGAFVNNRVDPRSSAISLKMMSMLPVPDPARTSRWLRRYVLRSPTTATSSSTRPRRLSENDRRQARVRPRVLHEIPARAAVRQERSNLLLMSGSGLGNDARMTTMASGLDWVISPKLRHHARDAAAHRDAAYRG